MYNHELNVPVVVVRADRWLGDPNGPSQAVRRRRRQTKRANIEIQCPPSGQFVSEARAELSLAAFGWGRAAPLLQIASRQESGRRFARAAPLNRAAGSQVELQRAGSLNVAGARLGPPAGRDGVASRRGEPAGGAIKCSPGIGGGQRAAGGGRRAGPPVAPADQAKRSVPIEGAGEFREPPVS